MRRFAAVVVLAAASAVSGCVTVSPRQPGPELSSGRAPSPVPARGPIVQPPAHEVLATVRPEPAGRTRHPAPVTAPAPTRPPPPPPPPPVTTRTAEPRLRPTAPVRSTAPSAAAPPGAATDVCALGETYGGWSRGSDAYRICRDTYGN